MSLPKCTLPLIFVLSLTPIAMAQSVSFSKYDQLKMSVQKICPVSGELLKTADHPQKVRIGQEEIFLCCQGCTRGTINKEHWITIHKNFAAAQGLCPVMEKPLPPNPKSTVVNGQTVYLCCPPCAKKIQAEPRKYLTKLAGYYQASRSSKGVKAKTRKGAHDATIAKSMAALPKQDQLHAKAQKICPVSGNPLGVMGVPHKVRAGSLDIFLCCEGCKEGKIDKQHWATMAQHLKSAQAKCPVMEKPLPSNAKSTVVNGQLVFVCCPPCTKKISAEPAKYLAKVDGYRLSSLQPAAKR